jgi:hypothetical protein
MSRKPSGGYELSFLVKQIPTDVLPRLERAVLRALADHYPNIWPSVALLGKEAGYCRSSTAQALRNLEKRKLIALKDGSSRKGGRQTATYIIDIAAVMLLAAAKQIGEQPSNPETSELESSPPIDGDEPVI